MEFHLRARSIDTLTTVHVFNGDDLIDDDTYRCVMTDGYMSTLSFVKGAAEGIGLDLDSETLERWKRVTNAAYYIDDFVDTAPNTEAACRLYAQGMELAFGHSSQQLVESVQLPVATDDRLVPSIILLKNSVSELPPEQLAVLRQVALSINAITMCKTTCTDIKEYIRLLKEEARLTSVLVIGSASEAVCRQPGFEKFADWCELTLVLATLGDSAIDLRADSRRQLTGVKPTVAAMSRLALQVVSPGRAMIHDKTLRHATLASLGERSLFYWRPT